MYKKILYLFVIAMLGISILAGCSKDDTPAAEEVKSEAEYKADAEKEITAENMDQTLSDIEKDIEAEISQEE
jgi:outer membrane protein assembly factor BamD (BamD/ComL family)